MPETPKNLETDPRFPSGPWCGFWIQKYPPIGRHKTELLLTFSNGVLTGEGRDWVGKYTVRGRYNLTDGRCAWIKHYTGKHDVLYEGFNEGKGIWGTWEVPGNPAGGDFRGGFHIWPEGMTDPTQSYLKEEADLPIVQEEEVEAAEPIAAPQ